MTASALFRFSLIAFAFVLIVAACGGDSDSDLDRPADFSEISVGQPFMTPDPSGVSATLTVTTSIDALCGVAFGETEQLGSLATDQDMGGQGHDQHNAILTGLTPDTEYFYRLQGVGPDGRLYQSELLTFTTSSAPESDSHGKNVTLGAQVIEVSSEFSDAFGAANAVEGDLATEWSSAGDGDSSFITIDLGGVLDLIGVEFLTRTMGDGSATTETFYVVVDGDERLGPFDAGSPAVSGVNPIEVSGQTLRFEVDSSTGGNTGAIEVRVFAEDD